MMKASTGGDIGFVEAAGAGVIDVAVAEVSVGAGTIWVARGAGAVVRLATGAAYVVTGATYWEEVLYQFAGRFETLMAGA